MAWILSFLAVILAIVLSIVSNTARLKKKRKDQQWNEQLDGLINEFKKHKK